MQDPRLASALLAGTAVAATLLASPAGAVSLPSFGEAPPAITGRDAGASVRRLLEGAIIEPLLEASTIAAPGGDRRPASAASPDAVEVQPVALAGPASARAVPRGEKLAERAPASPRRMAEKPPHRVAEKARSDRQRLITDVNGIAIFERESGDHLVRAAGALQVFDPRAGMVRVAAAATGLRPPAIDNASAAAEAAAVPSPAPEIDGPHPAAALLVAALLPAPAAEDPAPAPASTAAVERRPIPITEPPSERTPSAGDPPPREAARPIVLAEHRWDKRAGAAKPAQRPEAASSVSRSRPRAHAGGTAGGPSRVEAIAVPQPGGTPVEIGRPAAEALGLFLAFDPTSAAIDPQDLRDVALRLADDRTLRIQLTGYATIGGALATGPEPPAGSAAAKLGVHRSLAVRARLVEQGVDARRFVLTRPGQGADGVLAVLTRAA